MSSPRLTMRSQPGPTSQEVGGLKFKALGIEDDKIDESHLAGGGWIEIIPEVWNARLLNVPPRRRWVD